MNGKAKKVVTSGRLAGKAARSSPGLVASAHPDPAYSLYSTDSEDQVTTLHRGLDRCAALLSSIMQVDGAASPDVTRTLKPAKARASSTVPGKKSMKKLPFKAASPGFSRTMKGGAAKSKPVTSEGKTATKNAQTKAVQLSSRSGQSGRPQRHRPAALQRPSPPPQPAASLSGGTERRCVSEREADGGEELVPVRDTGESRPAASSLEEQSCDGTRTLQGLLGELRTPLSAHGGAQSEAGELLRQLERVVSPRLNGGGSDVPTDGAAASSLLEEKTLLQSEDLQHELSAAQSRLQELQTDLADLRKALEDTQQQLQSAEAERERTNTDLELTRSRLLESEREKSELASLSQRRLEEMEKLRRFIQTWCPSDLREADEDSVTEQRRDGRDAAGPSADQINRYLLSLSEAGATLSAARPWSSAGNRGCGRQSDVESVLSYWSMRSGSTFDTRDEAAFRDGLAALDASIASLQKTIQVDLKK